MKASMKGLTAKKSSRELVEFCVVGSLKYCEIVVEEFFYGQAGLMNQAGIM